MQEISINIEIKTLISIEFLMIVFLLIIFYSLFIKSEIVAILCMMIIIKNGGSKFEFNQYTKSGANPERFSSSGSRHD